MNNIKIPENLEGIIMEDMNKIKDEEISKNNNGKKSNAKKIIGIVALLVVVAGVAGYKAGWINKENNTAISGSQSETESKTSPLSSDKLKEEYTDNLTDAANGKLACLKLLGNNELQMEEHEDYYTYIDDFENKYNIKEITNVTSEEGMMGNDDLAALFKVTVTYVDNNNKTKTMDLAIILLPNHEIQNKGTFDNYTGSTSFVKNFTNL